MLTTRLGKVAVMPSIPLAVLAEDLEETVDREPKAAAGVWACPPARAAGCHDVQGGDARPGGRSAARFGSPSATLRSWPPDRIGPRTVTDPERPAQRCLRDQTLAASGTLLAGSRVTGLGHHQLPDAVSAEDDTGRGDQVPDLLTFVDDQPSKRSSVNWSKMPGAGMLKVADPCSRAGPPCRCRRCSPRPREPARRVDGPRDVGEPVAVEGGGPAGGDRPDDRDRALEGERVAPFDCAFRALRAPSVLLRLGDRHGSPPLPPWAPLLIANPTASTPARQPAGMIDLMIVSIVETLPSRVGSATGLLTPCGAPPAP